MPGKGALAGKASAAYTNDGSPIALGCRLAQAKTLLTEIWLEGFWFCAAKPMSTRARPNDFPSVY